MMYSIDDFDTIEQNRTSRASDFSSGTEVDQMARTLLVSTANLELIKEEIETDSDLAQHVDDEHKFQHSLAHSSVHGFYSVYRSVKHHSYNSTYRDIRYLYESWLILKGLNQRKQEAGQLWKTHRVQAQSLVGGIEENPTFDFESVDELGKIRDSERDKLYNKYDSMREVVNYISQRAAHPLRIDGSYLEGHSAKGQKYEQMYFSLALLYAITMEYEVTFEGTPIHSHIDGYTDEIAEQVKETMPNMVPAFLDPYLD